jgi:putative SOS response-associated peptidase YedK
MCGRFAQFNPLDILKARFEIETVTAIPAPSYNIAPTREVPVLIDHQGLRLGIMKWGFTFSHAPKDRKPGLIINARAETLGEKKTFREAFARRRCLILADGFYEWKQEGKTKIPFYFSLPDRQPFAFAGLWQTIQKEDGSSTGACVIITRNAEGPIRAVHDRMPAIVDMDRIRDWLAQGSTDQAMHEQILADGCITDLHSHPVSPLVNSAGFDSPQCIEDIGQET